MNKEQFDKKVAEFKKIFGFIPPFDRILLLTTKKWVVDIIALDRELERYTPGYDADRCMYKGKPDYSMKMVIEEVYGERAVELVREMMLTKTKRVKRVRTNK